jgi:crossover junction endodeoxyribonuclease RuvC
VASGTISTLEGHRPRGDLPARLKIIFDGVREVMQALPPRLRGGGDRVRQCQPAEHAAAGPGARRGAGGAGRATCRSAEYTALQMKKAVVGHGLAKKEQIQAMVQRLLTLPGLPGKDAADALGLAIMHAHASVSFSAMSAKTALQRRQHAQFKGGTVSVRLPGRVWPACAPRTWTPPNPNCACC